MALTNRQRIDNALMALRQGLVVFLEQVITARHNATAWQYAVEGADRFKKSADELDLTPLFNIFHEYRSDVSEFLDKSAMNMLHESQDIRNRYAHQQDFSSDDTLRALDTIARVLEAIRQNKLHEEVRISHEQLLRESYERQTFNDTRKYMQALKSQADAALTPWREVITPHDDVRTGQLKQAEFAADLNLVALGKAGREYQEAHQFFSRTYLTEGLTELLRTAIQRLLGTGGDPVVELQTNFGGGKTHSMIALFHIAGGDDLLSIPVLEELLKKEGLKAPLAVARAVIVGTKLSPSEIETKPDGTQVRTIWGDMAWQLAGQPGYALVQQSDLTGVAPGGAVLQQLLELAGPSLILIDEWVAFMRQLYAVGDNPVSAGSFEANLTFAQALTEAVAATPKTLLAASLPSSEIEVGTHGGAEALDRLKHTFSRVKATWRAATSNEGFEIVRRRLFKEIDDPRKRDATIRMYLKMYEDNKGQFPNKVYETEYKRRMEAAYPFHPETFDLLFEVWGSLERFQRTRGVLRLMANVVHTLWERGDASPLIMPANLPLDATGVVTEVGGYLEDSWSSIIERDIDGDHALSISIDRENTNFDKVSATRRVARTIFMGSAPTFRGENKGIDDRTIRLGVVQPGEQIAIFGDALRTLADRATYLYSEQGRYWFSTQATITQVAQERIEQLPLEDVDYAIVELLRKHQSQRDIFDRVHVATNGGSDIIDSAEATLVLLGPQYTHVRRRDNSLAMVAAGNILDMRGNARRQHRNGLIFLAPDDAKLSDLRKAVAQHIVWTGIVEDSEEMNLDPQQLRQAKSKLSESGRTVQSRLRETWCWLMAPHSNPSPSAPIEWETRTLPSMSDSEMLAVAASKRAENEEWVVRHLAGSMLRKEIEKIPQFSDNWTHIPVRSLADWFADYTYLQRLQNPQVLEKSIREGMTSMVWQVDGFAYADQWDEESGRYRGLRAGPQAQGVEITLHGTGVLVHPETAKIQMDEDERQAQIQPAEDTTVGYLAEDLAGIAVEEPASKAFDALGSTPIPAVSRRYFGSTTLDPQTLSSQVKEISQYVISRLSGVYGSNVSISLEISADIPNGVPEDVRKDVENMTSELRFTQSEFVEE